MPEVRMSEQNICDFCSEPKWARRFQCTDFPMDESPGFPRLVSKSDWLACSTCASLIDAGNWNGLLLRAVDRFAQKYPMPRRILTDRIKQLHDQFRGHYRKAEQ